MTLPADSTPQRLRLLKEAGTSLPHVVFLHTVTAYCRSYLYHRLNACRDVNHRAFHCCCSFTRLRGENTVPATVHLCGSFSIALFVRSAVVTDDAVRRWTGRFGTGLRTRALAGGSVRAARTTRRRHRTVPSQFCAITVRALLPARSRWRYNSAAYHCKHRGVAAAAVCTRSLFDLSADVCCGTLRAVCRGNAGVMCGTFHCAWRRLRRLGVLVRNGMGVPVKTTDCHTAFRRQ